MKILWLDSTDSTNAEALRKLSIIPSGTVIAAREQTAGRGQRGNRWFAEVGKNLTFSIVLKFPQGELPAREGFRLNYLASLAVERFLEEHGVACNIKWPNDIYVRRSKICGILIENSLEGEWVSASVIGVGLNVNQREFSQLANATSLGLCTGKEYDLKDCMEQFACIFESLLPSLPQGDALLEQYSQNLFLKGVTARFHDLLEDREYTGVISSVAPDGRLCILEGSTPHYYRFKEVGYIL